MPKTHDLDVKSAVTRIVPTETKNTTKSVSYYNVEGQPTKSDADVCAAVVKIGKRFAYKIKLSREGKLYDPKQNGPSYSLGMKDKLTGDDAFVLREVSPNAFELYLRYLQQRFDSLLLSAQREI